METILLVVYCIVGGVIGLIVGMLIERIVLQYKDRKLVNKNETQKARLQYY